MLKILLMSKSQEQKRGSYRNLSLIILQMNTERSSSNPGTREPSQMLLKNASWRPISVPHTTQTPSTMTIQPQNSLPFATTHYLSTYHLAPDLQWKAACFTSVGGNCEKHSSEVSGMSPGDLCSPSEVFGDNLIFTRKGLEAKQLPWKRKLCCFPKSNYSVFACFFFPPSRDDPKQQTLVEGCLIPTSHISWGADIWQLWLFEEV